MNIDIFEAIHADPWAEQIVDLSSLNAEVSISIEDAIARQRDVARRQPRELRSSSLVILGPPGAGKTHLFTRLRQRLGPKAVFVHVRPLLNSEMTARFVLHEIAKQLCYATAGLSRMRQIDALVGSLFAHLDGASATFSSVFLADMAHLEAPERDRRIDEALESVLGTWQDADESYLRRLLSVPFEAPATSRAAMAWLSGRECDESQLKRIGTSSSLPEEAVIPALRTLAAVASLGAPIVLVFDQLENLIDGQESRPRLLAYANLAAELVDSARGIVLVHMAIDTEWNRVIEPTLGASHRSRIIMQTKVLSLPTPAQREELLKLWAARTASPKAPFPWPFGERRVARWCNALGMTPRMLLVECRMALENGDPDDEPAVAGSVIGDAVAAEAAGAEVLKDSLAKQWTEHLESARRTLDDLAEQAQCADPARLADGFVTAAGFVPSLTLEVNLREPAQLAWGTSAGKVRMAILYQNHHRSLGTALLKLTALTQEGPVMALRERTHDIVPTWKDTLAKRASFVAKANARWAVLEREDAGRLLALASMLTEARSGDITDASGRPVPLDAVRHWVGNTLEVASWPVLAGLTIPASEAPDEVDEGCRFGASIAGTALGVLRRLRVASLDRLVREVLRVDRAATRASTLLELERASDRVAWIGGAIVCVKGEL